MGMTAGRMGVPKRRWSGVEGTVARVAPLVLGLLSGALTGCGGAAPEGFVAPSNQQGALQLSLRSESGGVVYRLAATFSLSGRAELTFDTGELSSDDEVLEQTLAAGSYQLRIDDFELFAETEQGSVAQEAELLSPAEQAIQIFPDDTTRVTYRFGVPGDEVAFGDGNLAVDFTVEETGCQTEQLPVSVVDADYSAALDRVVLLGTAPNAITILDPRTLEQTAIALPVAGSDVSVSPDGTTAAVAHDGFLSLVDLAGGALLDTIPTSSPAGDVVLADNGFAYILPIYDQWVSLHSIDLAARADVTVESFGFAYAGTRIALHASGESIYGITVGLSPTDIQRFDISAGPAVSAGDSPYHGDYAMCADLWPSEDGLRLFTGCGTVFRTLPEGSDDMTYNGSLQGGSNRFSAIVHDEPGDRVYALGVTGSDIFNPQAIATRLETYSYEYLALEDSRDIPCFQVPQGEPRAIGEYVFASAEGDAVFVVSRADPEAGLLRNWGIATLSP
jgi:hypothetical protein